ncbi:MAG: NADH-quinone oxidoreductase subunit C [Nitrospira bacterium HGW-Nitrospira-1]|nr:MAG: NADH-quinone oxidoreductase subunit C [Nitrospira bacterium HGW-Nitrospira-1]
MKISDLIALLKERLRDVIVGIEEMPNNDVMLEIKRHDLLPVLTTLKKDKELGFISFTNQLGVDYGDSFAVIYNLYSFALGNKLTVKVFLEKDNPEVDSVERLFRGANWFERETYDLLGIRFKGHGNLERLLLPSDWEGYPLRKDYVYPEEYHGMALKRKTLFEE